MERASWWEEVSFWRREEVVERSCELLVMHSWVSRMQDVVVRWARRAGRADLGGGRYGGVVERVSYACFRARSWRRWVWGSGDGPDDMGSEDFARS